MAERGFSIHDSDMRFMEAAGSLATRMYSKHRRSGAWLMPSPENRCSLAEVFARAKYWCAIRSCPWLF